MYECLVIFVYLYDHGNKTKNNYCVQKTTPDIATSKSQDTTNTTYEKTDLSHTYSIIDKYIYIYIYIYI